jgi:hypothetical protein
MFKRLRVMLVAVVVVAALLAAAAPALATHRPTRVMIVVMDQMQPGYAKQFNMKNVLWLQDHGVTFPKAYVGDMASETVVSHNVMVSGLLPKHMGWSDEAFRDVDNLLGYGENAVITTGDLGYADYVKLIENMDYPKIGDYLHAKFPGKKVVCVGEKPYQIESMTASSADIAVRLGSRQSTPLPPLPGKWRGPAGVSVPTYISLPADGRFYISSDTLYDSYETTSTPPAWLYPEDGRMTPGFAGHEGGDSWVADATTAIMDNEDWSGIFVNFGAIDKIGHMWGGGSVDTQGNYHWDPTSILNQVHMPFIAKHADEQLGKLIAKLKALHEFNDTLIVVTADHGSTHAEHFNGINALDAGSATNWYAGTWFPGYGSDAHIPNTSPGSPALKPLLDTGNVAFSYQSTAIETWLIDRAGAKKREDAAVMEKLPGVIATYIKNGDRYQLFSSLPTMTAAERVWWMAHGQELVDTMCFSGSADLVGLLADKTSYGVYGDHGGAQKDVQSIPMAWYMPGLKHAVSMTPLRLVDIMPTMLNALGIKPTERMDGSAYSLNLPK